MNADNHLVHGIIPTGIRVSALEKIYILENNQDILKIVKNNPKLLKIIEDINNKWLKNYKAEMENFSLSRENN